MVYLDMRTPLFVIQITHRTLIVVVRTHFLAFLLPFVGSQIVAVFGFHLRSIGYFLYSKISPGWQSKASQMASSVDKRTAFALLFFKMDIFASVMPTFSASVVTLIFLFASMTSMLMTIAIGITR